MNKSLFYYTLSRVKMSKMNSVFHPFFPSLNAYCFSFNGKEKDDETYGGGNEYDFWARIYNPRLGKFLSVDPLYMVFPYNSPYLFADNNPIWKIDLKGAQSEKKNEVPDIDKPVFNVPNDKVVQAQTEFQLSQSVHKQVVKELISIAYPQLQQDDEQYAQVERTLSSRVEVIVVNHNKLSIKVDLRTSSEKMQGPTTGEQIKELAIGFAKDEAQDQILQGAVKGINKLFKTAVSAAKTSNFIGQMLSATETGKGAYFDGSTKGIATRREDDIVFQTKSALSTTTGAIKASINNLLKSSENKGDNTNVER